MSIGGISVERGWLLVPSSDIIITNKGLSLTDDNAWKNLELLQSRSRRQWKLSLSDLGWREMQDQKQLLPKNLVGGEIVRPIPFRHTEWFCQNVQLSALLVFKLTDRFSFLLYWYCLLASIYILDILFSSNHNVHKSLCDLYFWTSDLLINRFY